MNHESGIEPQSVTYWESRQVNIGDYESVSFGSTVVTKFIDINKTDKKAQIDKFEEVTTYPVMSRDAAIESCIGKVKAVLDAREKELRLNSHKNGGTNFDTLKKAEDFSIITKEEKPKDIDLDDDFEIEEKVVENKTKSKKKEELFSDDDFDFDMEEEEKPRKKKAKVEAKPSKKFFLKGKKEVDPEDIFPTDQDDEIPF